MLWQTAKISLRSEGAARWKYSAMRLTSGDCFGARANARCGVAFPHTAARAAQEAEVGPKIWYLELHDRSELQKCTVFTNDCGISI